ncbi:DUF397 domain-containing protein [Streptomyces sp. NBC_00878]|uniref:DUF397 domain-containing protein n=1 Tax=Streptomyces sp. NBC_00878 TaxID=2975854 RepID=UPI00224E0B43|nr:DUF397 domain-containing protein [Streptomyces sp. NBC_00878]MCX4906421.1 DUF397 domain-containing protein [Streptomyces sp. NBC_00878]
MASTEPDLSSARWHTSGYSNATGGDCVEVASNLPGVVPVRDSKSQDSPVLLISPTTWTTFIAALLLPPE